MASHREATDLDRRQVMTGLCAVGSFACLGCSRLAFAAAELGYAWICHPDFAIATAFNPKMHLKRDTTLMQGESCCNHRWEVEA